MLTPAQTKQPGTWQNGGGTTSPTNMTTWGSFFQSTQNLLTITYHNVMWGTACYFRMCMQATIHTTFKVCIHVLSIEHTQSQTQNGTTSKMTGVIVFNRWMFMVDITVLFSKTESSCHVLSSFATAQRRGKFVTYTDTHPKVCLVTLVCTAKDRFHEKHKVEVTGTKTPPREIH